MNEKILIADDEKGVVEMLKSYFVNINMSDMDGLTACKKNPRLSKI